MACQRCGNNCTTGFTQCPRCSTPPAPLVPPQASSFRSPRYDNAAMLEGFLLGIMAAWSTALLGMAVSAFAFFLSWGAFVVLFMYFPVPVTGPRHAGLGGHMRALAVLRGSSSD